jgi:hypothetical protein
MKDIIYEDLKIKLEELGFKVEWVLEDNSGYEDDYYYLNINGIDVFEGAYQKWDTCIEEEGYLEKSFMNDEDLINYLNK